MVHNKDDCPRHEFKVLRSQVNYQHTCILAMVEPPITFLSEQSRTEITESHQISYNYWSFQNVFALDFERFQRSGTE